MTNRTAARRATGGGATRFPPSGWLLALGTVLLACVLVLGAHLESVRGPVRTDSLVAGELVRDPNTSSLKEVAKVGSELPVLAAVIILMAWAASRRDWPAVVVAFMGPAGALFLTEYVLKPLVDRENAKGHLAYPSGHAAITAALATVALLFLYRYFGTRMALLWSPYAIAVVGAMAFAVVALGWHYITDSVGGVGLGVGVVFGVAAIADWWTSARRRLATRAGAA